MVVVEVIVVGVVLLLLLLLGYGFSALLTSAVSKVVDTKIFKTQYACPKKRSGAHA